MRRRLLALTIALIALSVLAGFHSLLAAGQNPLDKFVRISGDAREFAALVDYKGRFSGYTNYWQTLAWSWKQYGNLFLISQPDVSAAIAQNKADIAEELGIPGLVLDEGFIDAWLESRPVELEDPGDDALGQALDHRDVIVWAKPSSPLGARLSAKAPGLAGARTAFGSYQAGAANYHEVIAFVLVEGRRRLFAVLAEDAGDRRGFRELLSNVEDVVGRYDLHRGWFGTGTLLHSVTCHPGHPLEVIGQGLGQGNDWFTFSGYMDYLMQDQLGAWLEKVGLDVVVDVGTGKASHSLGTVAYGLQNYDGLKIQDMPTEEEWIRFVKDRGGHIFRPVYAPECDKYKYDGQIAIDGNKKQIDTEDVPFILQTGLIKDDAPAAMVLFTEKDRRFDRGEMWKAILDRKAVGVLPLGRMMGPAPFRRALQMLLLDRVYLEDLFGDRIRLEASVEGYDLHVRVANLGGSPFEGRVELRPAPEIVYEAKWVDVAVTGGDRANAGVPPAARHPRPWPRPTPSSSKCVGMAGGSGRSPSSTCRRPYPSTSSSTGKRRRSSILFPFITLLTHRAIRSRSGSMPRTGRRHPSS